jgi:glycosyltransferase involved in cell wall biosynthesis
MRSDHVSVIITSFNHEDYIAESIESVLSQTHKNTEIILVDDGSSDDTALIAKRLYGKWVHILTQPNAGPSSAVNVGLSKASGSFLALLSGDDYCTPRRLEEQLEFVKTNAYDLVFSSPIIVNKYGEELKRHGPSLFSRDVSLDIFSQLFLSGNFFCASSAFFRREVLDVVGHFRRGLVQLQDYDYWLRVLISGFSIGLQASPVVMYRRHTTNLSGDTANFLSQTELAYIIKDLIGSKQAARFVRSAMPHVLEPLADIDDMLSDLERVLILASHPNSYVKSTGLQYMLSLLEDDHFFSCLCARGVNPAKLLMTASSL